MSSSSTPLVDGRRPPSLRRCWLFLPGADRRALLAASSCGADVLIQELEDFTPPERRPEARALSGMRDANELVWDRAGKTRSRTAYVRLPPVRTR